MATITDFRNSFDRDGDQAERVLYKGVDAVIEFLKIRFKKDLSVSSVDQ